MDKIILIAGNGKFPLLFAEAAKRAGTYVVAIAFREETDRKIVKLADKTHWISVGQLKKLVEIVQNEQIKKAIMCGQIRHRWIFAPIVLDDELKKLLKQLQDKRTDTILGALARRIEALGVTLVDSTTFLKDYLPKKGVLTRCLPSEKQWQDIEFGLKIAKSIAALDIGQTVVVKNKVVLSIEAIEGTDQTIRRASRYVKGGCVVVKVSKPKQDMRFDVPLVGEKTLKTLIRSRAAVLAVEAEKTLFLDKSSVLACADKHNICIVAV
ncbi:MAG: UDP-2,3-diacylglucosamine diphosphatase LpxI [Candidatus Omnitrophica bacterium]|nr:UDP-2,3-diacylglucosamine diphosphatase LpxI [Candidatus Omnitrophota bacterium]